MDSERFRREEGAEDEGATEGRAAGGAEDEGAVAFDSVFAAFDSVFAPSPRHPRAAV